MEFIMHSSIVSSASSNLFTFLGAITADTSQVTDQLKSITPEKVVVWLLIGLVVGRFIGLMLAPTHGGIGPIGSLLLGLIGALVGGIALDKAGVKMDLGTLEIPYADVVAAAVGSLILVFGYWIMRLKMRSSSSSKDKAAAK
jgi:uncharacterized membrane protein YeaQ/YmgE (transglycosylase-associated protein family)